MTTQTLPGLHQVRNTFEDLMIPRECDVKPADPVTAKDVPASVVALYTDTSGSLAAVMALDLSLAAYAGAALGVLPPGGAQDAIEEKKLTPVLADNVKELCNILTGLVGANAATRLKLHQTFLPGESVPSDAQAYLLALGRRLDVDVKIKGYGGGKLSVALAG